MSEPTQFTSSTARFGFPYLFTAQTQRELFVNESLAKIDMLLQPAIESLASEPPPDPAEGQAWIVGQTPTGPWELQQDTIAIWQAGAWQFAVPFAGLRVWHKQQRRFLNYDTGWQAAERPQAPAGGAMQDTELRAAFGELLASLANAGIFPVI